MGLNHLQSLICTYSADDLRPLMLKATVPLGLKNDPNNPRYWLKDAWRQLFITRKLISNLSYFARIDKGWIQVFASNVLLILQIAFFHSGCPL